jgi:VWFA-related protein
MTGFKLEKGLCFRDALSKYVCFGLMLTLSVTFLSAQSQDKTQNKKPVDDDIIRVNANLVNLDVIVKDKKGKVVKDLKAEDFVVLENGVKQNIEFFNATLGTDSSSKGTEPVTVTTETSTPRLQPQNLVALVLDGQTTEATNLKPVRDGIVKFVRDRITTDDSAALFAIAGGLQLLQPFTQDKDKLVSAVEKSTHISAQAKTSEQRELSAAIDKLRNDLAGAPSLEGITTQAGGSAALQAMITKRVLEQFLQLRSTLSNQQTRPILAALAAICEGLRPMRGKKTLVMFSQGFVASEVLDWQVQSTIDIANRANVSIYIIDSSGLKGGVPQSSAVAPPSALAGISAAVDQESRIRTSAGESIFDISRYEGINRQQDLLFRISEDTGGHFIKNTNDFSDGLNRVDDEIRSRYTLAYRSTDQNFDGKFRKVKIELRRPDVNIVARPGYFAIPPTQVVPSSPAEREMIANFSSIEARSTLPISIEANSSFKAQDGSYVVPLLFDIPPASVQFAEHKGKRRLQLDVMGLIRKEGEDEVLSRLGGNFNVELTPEQYQSILNDKIFYRQDIELEPGNYTVDLMVKDKASGKTAARREKILLPAVNEQFSATTPILSRRANTVVPTLNKPADVLTVGNMLIRPSPSRQFLATDNLIILFRVYNAALAPNGRPLVRVSISLMRDDKLATKRFDFDLSELEKDPVPHLAFAKFIKLTGLQPGKYKAVIESRDMVQLKLSKTEAWFEIVQ